MFYNATFSRWSTAFATTVPGGQALSSRSRDQYESLLAAAGADFTPPSDIKDDDLAELFYTSGTTANPKGVMMTHRNLYMHAMQVIGGLGVNDSIVQLHTIPLFHVNGWGTPHTLTCMGARHMMTQKV